MLANMLLFYLAVYSYFFNSVFAVSIPPNRTRLVVDRFDGMCEGDKLIMTSVYRVSKAEKSTIYLNATMRIKENIDDKLFLNIKMVRCRTKENLDSCEDFVEQNNLPYCTLTDPILPQLSPMYIDFHPKFTCPPKKGVYKAYNSKIDVGGNIGFSLDNYYWRAKMTLFTVKTKKLVQCIKVEGYVH